MSEDATPGMSNRPVLAEQIAELRRELAVRQRVYPRWVAMKRIGAAEAAHAIECLQAAIASLEKLSGIRGLVGELESLALDIRALGKGEADEPGEGPPWR